MENSQEQYTKKWGQEKENQGGIPCKMELITTWFDILFQ